MTEIDENKKYVKYARDVLSGKIVACKWIKLAAKRFFDFMSRDDMYFDYADVDKRIRFVAKLKHATGIFNGKHFILLPWQEFIFANIFGFKWLDTGYRVTKKVNISVSRKNGKTALAAAIALAQSLIDNEGEPQISFVANSSQQASIALKMCLQFAQSVDPKQKVWKQYRSEIRIPSNNGVIHVMSADSGNQDGYNDSCFVYDECHAAKTSELYDVHISGQGMRTQPLAICISTFGFLLNGNFYYDYVELCKDILIGMKQDDTQFSAIYTLDEDDDYTDERNWKKCSPSLGDTVLVDYYKEQVIAAKNSKSREIGIKTKNFNMWCSSSTTWIDVDYIKNAMAPVNLENFPNEFCFMGADLSSVSDLTAISILLPPNEKRDKWQDKYIFKTLVWVPQEALDTSPNAFLYRKWISEGYLKMTSGNVVDYDEILADQKKLVKDNFCFSCAYDAYNATQWAVNCVNEGFIMTPYSQSLASFNKPTKFFEVLVKQGKVIMEYTPVIAWMFSNVELKFDHNENCKPFKAAGDKNKKIDGVISMLEALAAFMLSPQCAPEITAI